MRRNAKIDSTHREVVKALRQCGFRVADTHALSGFVDVVAEKRGRVWLIEIKREKGGRLTASQQKLIADGWPITVLRTVDDVIAFAQAA